MDRLELTIEIAERKIGAKRVNVRSSLKVESLLDEIRNHHSLDGQFRLLRKSDGTPLATDHGLDQLGIANGTVLVCDKILQLSDTQARIQRGVPERFSKQPQRVYLVEERTRLEYDVEWQPAIIGRKDRSNPAKNRLLAVDLEELEQQPSVSRQHACLTEKNGVFYVESLNPSNLAYLNGEKLRVGLPKALTPGAVIKVGQITLTFNQIG